jgi:hypothetical protein
VFPGLEHVDDMPANSAGCSGDRNLHFKLLCNS